MKFMRAFFLFVMLISTASAYEIFQETLVPEHKSVEHNDVRIDITYKELYTQITPNASTHCYGVRIFNGRATEIHIPSIAARYDMHYVQGSESSNYRYFEFESYRAAYDSEGEIYGYYTNWNPIAFSNLTIPAGETGRYAVCFDINEPFAQGNFNVSYTVGGAGGTEYFLDPDISACGTLSTASTTYTLTADITDYTGTCFIINANDITLDLNGHTVDGVYPTLSYVGVKPQANNSIIKNGVIQQFRFNIADLAYSDTHNITFQNITINAATSTNVVYVYAADGNHINWIFDNCSFENNTALTIRPKTNISCINSVFGTDTGISIQGEFSAGEKSIYLYGSTFDSGTLSIRAVNGSTNYLYGYGAVFANSLGDNIIDFPVAATFGNNAIWYVYDLVTGGSESKTISVGDGNITVYSVNVTGFVPDDLTGYSTASKLYEQYYARLDLENSSGSDIEAAYSIQDDFGNEIANSTATGLTSWYLVNSSLYDSSGTTAFDPHRINSYPTSATYADNLSNQITLNETKTVEVIHYAAGGTGPSVTGVGLGRAAGGSCASLNPPIYVNTYLTCYVNTTDPDTATLSLNFTWNRNGTAYRTAFGYGLVANATHCSLDANATYGDAPASVIKKSDTWTCSAQAYDGSNYSSIVTSPAITVNNTAPTVDAPTLNDSTPKNTDTLLCSAAGYSDADGDTAGASYYRWWVNGIEVPGATSSTLYLGGIGAAYGDRINCSHKQEDSGYDAKNSTEKYSAQAIVQSPPWTTDTTLCIGTGCGALTTIYVDTALNCSAKIYDNDTATIQELRFDFDINGSDFTYCVVYNVPNATTQYDNCILLQNPPHIPGLYFAKGDTIYCESRGYDGLYYSSYDVSTAYTVNNTAPTADAPILDTYNPSNTTVINCSVSGYNDTDGDSPGASYYLWWHNGANTGVTTNSYNLSYYNASDGDVLYCEGWVEDSGYDAKNSTHLNSSAATVGTIGAPTITDCSSGFDVLNFSVLDEQNFNPIFTTMEATFTLFNYSSGDYLSNVSFFIENQTFFEYCIYPYAALTIVSSYQTYYPYSGSGYNQRNYYLYNSTLDATTPQQINIYLLNSSVSDTYTIQVVNQYLVPLEGVKLTMYRFMPVLNAWVTVAQASTDLSGYSYFDLQPGTLYKLAAEKDGYITLNAEFTPGVVTNIQIRMQEDSELLIQPLPNFEIVWEDVSYSLLPTGTFFNESAYCEFSIASASSSLQNFSMTIHRRYNGTTTTVYFVNVTTSPAGGALNYTATLPGEYSLQISFKHSNYTNPYTPLPLKFFVGNNTGAVAAKLQLSTGVINAWAYYFFALVATMLAAGFALRYSPEASGAAGLLVLWLFTFFYPTGVIVTVAGVGITILYATVLTSIMVGAAMALKWYI